MATGGGDFERAFHGLLTFDFGEIRLVLVRLIKECVEVDFCGREANLSYKKADGFAEVLNRNDIESRDHGGFGGVVLRHEDAELALGFRAQRDGQDALDRANSTSWECINAPSGISASSVQSIFGNSEGI